MYFSVIIISILYVFSLHDKSLSVQNKSNTEIDL